MAGGNAWVTRAARPEVACGPGGPPHFRRLVSANQTLFRCCFDLNWDGRRKRLPHEGGATGRSRAEPALRPTSSMVTQIKRSFACCSILIGRAGGNACPRKRRDRAVTRGAGAPPHFVDGHANQTLFRCCFDLEAGWQAEPPAPRPTVSFSSCETARLVAPDALAGGGPGYPTSLGRLSRFSRSGCRSRNLLRLAIQCGLCRLLRLVRRSPRNPLRSRRRKSRSAQRSPRDDRCGSYGRRGPGCRFSFRRRCW